MPGANSYETLHLLIVGLLGEEWLLHWASPRRPENFCVQVWTAHEAGRTARVAKVANRTIQVRVWDCMYGEVESFIHFVNVGFHFVDEYI